MTEQIGTIICALIFAALCAGFIGWLYSTDDDGTKPKKEPKP